MQHVEEERIFCRSSGWVEGAIGAFAVVFMSGCQADAVQSMLNTVGPAAAEIEWLWWLMFAMGAGVFVIVSLFLLISIFRRGPSERDEPPFGTIPFVVAGGAVIPAIILVVLLIFALITQVAVSQRGNSLTVEVVGHMWWWEVNYPDYGIVDANEIYIPQGEPVQLELTSEDVVHSFWVPRLQGKRDLIPGHTNTWWIEADEPGVYRGQCAEYCGVQHALMAFRVIVLPPDEFETWLAERQEPPPEPETELQRRGRDVFMSETCVLCHRIEGTMATGTIGPDLTHVGSRLTLGAGIMENNRGNLSGWIVNAQAIKPGNRMPPTDINSEELHAMVEYLLSLE